MKGPIVPWHHHCSAIMSCQENAEEKEEQAEAFIITIYVLNRPEKLKKTVRLSK